MRILVAIANHGTRNEQFVQRLIDTYGGFRRHQVDIVVLSDVAKDLGRQVEVRVGAPTRDPWSLPFAHRPLFAERRDAYDIFIYSEDDTEVEERHVDAFLAATSVLPDDRIAGFMRYEQAPDGRRYCSTVHAHYHWDAASLLRAGGHTFARYGNDHAACYMLTSPQLAACIRSGGFLVAPHATRYDMLCSAATDPYTQCGFSKVVAISHLEDFLLHHLPDKYLGRIGVELDEVERQIGRLLALADAGVRPPLLELQADPTRRRHDKHFYEPYRPEALTLLPRPRARLLSVGCERGETEARLLRAGCAVTAVPLDDVIAASAELRGIRLTKPDLAQAIEQLAVERFDGLLFNNVLPYLREPAALVRRFRHLLTPDGFVIATFDNLSRLSRRHGLGRELRARLSRPTDTTATAVQAWLRAAGLRPDRVVYDEEGRSGQWLRAAGGILGAWIARRGAVRAWRVAD